VLCYVLLCGLVGLGGTHKCGKGKDGWLGRARELNAIKFDGAMAEETKDQTKL
jgi:hypothetical protein